MSEGLTVSQGTLTVISAPFQATFTLNTLRSNIPGEADQQTTRRWYQRGDVAYLQFEEGVDGWSIQPRNEGYLNWLIDDVSHIENARFAGQVDFQGMPANRFVFDQTGWVSHPTPGQQTVDTVQGSIDLAQKGNFPLHLEYRMVGNVWLSDSSSRTYLPGVTETTYDVSSIDQVAELVFPEDTPLQFDFDNVDVPLPADAQLSFVTEFDHKPPYNYTFTSDLSVDDLIAFYQALPTDGWTVSAAMKEPGGDSATVILVGDGQTVILSISNNPATQECTVGFQYSP